jgi:RNA polymerase sigma factor for flagellar operon FliA
MVMRLPANVRAYWEKDDLQSFGQLGLMEAIDRWAPDSPLDGLGAYATKWVRGSVYDELGRLEWLPRAVRRTIVDYHDRVDSLANDLRKTHASEHLLAEIGVVKRAKGEIPSLRSSQLLHLERAVGSTSSAEQARRLIDLVVDGDHVGPGTQVLAYVESEAVRLAITRLPERQRMIVTCHFLGGLTQEQIGLMLGVSNSRVGQIEASAMQTLWSVLGASRETTKLQAG